jgi:hypothetical protein
VKAGDFFFGFFLFKRLFFNYLWQHKYSGCLKLQAEITPIEPDAGNAVAGI